MQDSPKDQIDILWGLFRHSINTAYERNKGSNSPADCLRDYCEEQSMQDQMNELLFREERRERQHRRAAPSEKLLPKHFPVNSAAKLLIMQSALDGALRGTFPKPERILITRHDMFECEVIGWITERYFTKNWLDCVRALDYAKLMKVE